MNHRIWCNVRCVTSDPAIRAVAALDDDLRRGMYAFIRAARRPVTRDDAAAAVGISRKLAAFHLDKLVAAGVLQADYQATGARRVGRAPKVYRPADADIRVSLPPRRHDLLAEILLDAATSGVPGTQEAIRQAAYDRGHDIGAEERRRTRPGRLGAERALTIVAATMRDHGFDPVRESTDSLRLHTCPFHPMVATAPALVCGLNHAFLRGLVDGLDAPAVTAELAPRSGECCVELHRRT